MINGKYLYETHMHTMEASKCSDSPAREYIARYRDFGYDGIIITDHFYHGNTCVDRSLPWPEFVRRFCLGYHHAREEGERQGFPVYFGWEENFRGDEFLVYGLNEQFMLAHPEMTSWTRAEQYEAVRAAGGCVVQAHPFRARDYIRDIWLSPYFVDGIEDSDNTWYALGEGGAWRTVREVASNMLMLTDVIGRTTSRRCAVRCWRACFSTSR